MSAQLPPALVLTGPTASGKTACALALAQVLPVEIISVDSALVFRDMNIGTAKPDAAERAACPHHLIDLISPEDAYSAARFRHDCLDTMAAVAARGRLPLLVGGTMLYLKALRDGLSELPGADPELRAAIDARAQREGWPALHAELARRDPATAARLAPGDAQRIQRALEIVQLTGAPVDASLAQRATPALPWRLITLALLPGDRAELHQRIAARFDAMLDAGLVDEVRELRQRYRLDLSLPSMRCVGYRQSWQHLDGQLDPRQLRERGIIATRQLAKRQITWLRQFAANWPDFHPIDCTALPTHWLAGQVSTVARQQLEHCS